MNNDRSRSVSISSILPILVFLTAVLPAATSGDKGPGLAELYRTGRARLVADLVIDAGALPEKAQVQLVATMETDPTGSLYVLDMLACDIKKFDRTGKFIKSIGRKGQGPGEFQMPYLIAVGRNSFLVYDITSQKLNRLDLDGNFIRGLSVPFSGEDPKKIMSLPGGGFVLETEKDYYDISDKPQDIRIVTIGGEFEPGNDLYKRQIMRTKYRRTPQGPITNVPQPYVPDISWTVTHEGLVLIGISDKYTFDSFDPRKGRTGGFSWHSRPVRVTAEDRKRWFSSLSSNLKSMGNNVPGFIREGTDFPDFKPLFDRVLCDPEGNILVRPILEEPAKNIYDAFTPDGRFIARIDLSGGEKNVYRELTQTSDGSLWSWARDEDDNYIITRWRIAE